MDNKQAQHLLGYLGYYTGSVDGIWGNGSREAARRFQRDFGLPESGEPDSGTQDALRHAVAYGIPEREESGSFWDDIEYFTRAEFGCKCRLYHDPYCDGFPAEPKEAMVRIADRVRKELGVPVTVVSGLRCQRHNADDGFIHSSPSASIP